jgi:hypothetical protein
LIDNAEKKVPFYQNKLAEYSDKVPLYLDNLAEYFGVFTTP